MYILENYLIEVSTKDNAFEAELTGDSEFFTPNPVCPESEFIPANNEDGTEDFYATSTYKFLKHHKECSFKVLK